MLQQTTVRTVEKRFSNWMERFPDIRALADSSEEDALRAWEGLGYYSRVRRLREAACRVSEQGWPRTVEEWKSLPGVGAYVSAAVSSFTRDEPVFAFDSNLKRIILRLENLPSWSGTLEKTWMARAENIFLNFPSSLVNSAMMRLGQEVCLPRSPDCSNCPVHEYCGAFLAGSAKDLPVYKMRKQKIEETHFPRLLLRKNKNWELLLECSTSGRFTGQWLPPLGADLWWEQAPYQVIKKLPDRKQNFTHHVWTLVSWLVKVPDGFEHERTWQGENIWDRLPMPSVYRLIVRDIGSLLIELDGNHRYT